MQETRVQSLARADPLELEMATHSSILAWRNSWTEESGRLQSMGSQRVGHVHSCTALEDHLPVHFPSPSHLAKVSLMVSQMNPSTWVEPARVPYPQNPTSPVKECLTVAYLLPTIPPSGPQALHNLTPVRGTLSLFLFTTELYNPIDLCCH